MSNRKSTQIQWPASLANLIQLVERHPALPDLQRRDMRSAINTVAKVLGAPLHMLPADPAQLRDRLNYALPTAANVSPSRFRNAKSLLRGAMALHDPSIIPARSRVCLLPAWVVLLQTPEAQSVQLQRGLARFSKYCSQAGIPPSRVTQAVYDGFYEDLHARCLMRSPRETQQTAGHAWNTAAQKVPGWPLLVLVIASHRRNPSLAWSAFPASLSEDVERYLAPRTATGFRFASPAPRLRKTTIVSKRLMLRQFATCLVESGRDPATLHSLVDLVTFETAETGLAVLYARMGNQDSAHAYNIAYLLYGIAKHWLKLDPATVAALKAGCKAIRLPKDGMSCKNRLRLKQFDDPAKLSALLELPAKMMREVYDPTKKRTEITAPTKAEARIAQLAVAIEFFIMTPLRVKNVAELELGRTLILNGKTGHVIIDIAEVKNSVTIEAPLPEEFLHLLSTYLKRFHGLLAPPGCQMIFPSADNGHKRTTVLSHQITTCIAQRCGLEMNVHLFRHLAAKLYGEANPGAYGVIRMLLGHKNINTTIKTYCGMEFARAFRLHDANITRLRAGSTGSASTPSPSKRRG